MRARKLFYVVSYDVANNKRRCQVSTMLEKVGLRVNYSVFECMLTERQLAELSEQITKVIKLKEDTVIFYPLCVNCFSKIRYMPMHRMKGGGTLFKG